MQQYACPPTSHLSMRTSDGDNTTSQRAVPSHPVRALLLLLIALPRRPNPASHHFCACPCYHQPSHCHHMAPPQQSQPGGRPPPHTALPAAAACSLPLDCLLPVAPLPCLTTHPAVTQLPYVPNCNPPSHCLQLPPPQQSQLAVRPPQHTAPRAAPAAAPPHHP